MKRSDVLALGISEKDQIDGIMELHKADVELWKSQKQEMQDQHKGALDELNKKLAEVPKDGGEDWKAKYEAEVEAHGNTKSGYEAKETLAGKRAAAKEALAKAGAKPDILDDFLLGALDYDSIKYNDGKIEDADKFITATRDKYSKYFGKEFVEGVNPATPPTNNATTDPFLAGFNER